MLTQKHRNLFAAAYSALMLRSDSAPPEPRPPHSSPDRPPNHGREPGEQERRPSAA